jgi:hypothetical protein
VFTIVHLRVFPFYFLVGKKNLIIKKDKNIDRTPLKAQSREPSRPIHFAGART